MKLFISGDSICALTIAGAAEEILDKLVVKHLDCENSLELERTENSLDREVRERHELSDSYYKENIGDKKFMFWMNRPRNALKHLDTGGPMDFDIDAAAVEMIERAIENLNIYDREKENSRTTDLVKAISEFRTAASKRDAKKTQNSSRINEFYLNLPPVL